jgi:cell division protein FtsI/penicillin-binding protein 2
MVALLVVFTVFAGAAMLRLGYWQVVAAPGLVDQAAQSMGASRTPAVARAEIIGRDGEVLAQSRTYDQLEAHPALLTPDQQAAVLDTLATTLQVDADARAIYATKLASGRPWDWLERHLTPEQSLDIQNAKDAGLLPGIVLSPQRERVYPLSGGQAGTSLASHLVGFVAGDGGGTYGVEGAHEARLTGAEGAPVQVASLAGAGLRLDDASLAGLEAPPLRLTIDTDLQRQVEAELTDILINDRARSVSAVLMDPHTGAILASASVPSYDANEYAEVFADRRRRDLLRDRVISDTYEPGSVMKMFTVAAALSEGVVTPQTRIRDRVALKHAGSEDINNSDNGSIGTRSVRTMIAESRNVATALIARRLGRGSTRRSARLLYRTWERTGVVGATGVDLAGEQEGLARDPAVRPWQPVDLDNAAFGQGVSATLIQLATGYAPLMNGGHRVHPHVVADDTPEDAEPERVLTQKVARQTRDILTWVTGSVSRYAKGALLPGWVIGGKTGTAQIWDNEKKQFKAKRFNHTFVGFVGSNRPDVLIAVRIEEAKPLRVEPALDLKIESYEAFKKLARVATKVLRIPKSSDPQAGRPIPGTAAARQLPELVQRGPRSDRQGQGRDQKARPRSRSTQREAGAAVRRADRAPARRSAAREHDSDT